MKAYVTGGTGCVGRNLIDELLKANWEVTVLHRQSSDLTRLNNCNVKLCQVDLYDLQSVQLALAEPADALFHIAGNMSYFFGDRKQQYKDNVVVTQNLVDASLGKIGRFIFCSTGATGNYDTPTLELANQIESNYIKTKRLAEIVVEQAIAKGLDAVIINPGVIIGKYVYNNYVKIFSWLKNSKVRLSFPGITYIVHAEDVAKIHLWAFERGVTGKYYFLPGETISWHDVCCKICKLLHVRRPFKPFSSLVYYLGAFFMLQLSYITKKQPLWTYDLITLLCHQEVNRNYTIEKLEYAYRSADAALQDCYDWLVQEKII